MADLWKQFYAKQASFDSLRYKDVKYITVAYTNYRGIDSLNFTAIIGYAVPYLRDNIPKGLNSWHFKPDKFEKIHLEDIHTNTITDSWDSIKRSNEKLEKKFTYDYEVYHTGKDVYISVK